MYFNKLRAREWNVFNMMNVRETSGGLEQEQEQERKVLVSLFQ